MRFSDQLACVFHPMSLVLIDDDIDFVNRLKLKLGQRYVSTSFYDPKEALIYLQSYKAKNNIAANISSMKSADIGIQDYPELLDDNNYLHTYIDLKCVGFYEQVFCPERFKEQAIIVIDQVMPGMDGLDVCKQLRDHPYKIIMLTAEGGDSLARAAFNDGLIDHFVKKSDEDFVIQLLGAIHKLQKDYFNERSHTFIESLLKSPTCVLSDTRLINTLKEYMQKNNIIEYYLLNETGSFLMLEADGKPHWFAVVSENEIAEDYEFASGEDYQPDPKVLNGLNNRNMMLFRISEKQRMNIGPDGKTGWLSYMHPAKKFEAEHGVFYYSIFTGEAKQYFDGREVFSYQQFLLENESS